VVADVEGSERHFTGSDLDTLVEDCQLLVVELHFTPNRRSRFLDTMENHGFECLEIRGDVAVLSRLR
jgi:hypothetical protein